jgi:inhibitor of cysteine peptidase
MRRLLALVMASILTVSLIAGCGGGGVKTYIDPEEAISVSVDQEFVIALDSNPTTGYDWEESYDESMLTLDEAESKYVPDEKAEGLVGAGGTRYFRFKAIKAGQTEITLVYKRHWETEILEQKLFTVDIK